MLVAIVSHPDHSKGHVKALEKDGYEVLHLGPEPTSIPQSADIVVLRTDGCAHRGSETAMAWSRENASHPLIVENGVSGMRRALKDFFSDSSKYNGTKWVRAIQAIQETRPEDTKEEIYKALRGMEAPAQLAEAMIDSTFKAPEPDPVETPASQWTGEFEAFPEDEKWAKVVPEARLLRELKVTQGWYNKTPQPVRDEVREMYFRVTEGAPSFSPTGEVASRPGWDEFYNLQGKPLNFFLFVLKCLREGDEAWSRDLEECYILFTGKKVDRRVLVAASWVVGVNLLTGRKLNQNAPLDDEPEPEPKVEKVDLIVEADEEDDPAQILPDPFAKILEVRETLEDHVLELMEKTTELGKENATLRKQLEEAKASSQNMKDALSGVIEFAQSLQSRVEALTEHVAELALKKHPTPPAAPSTPSPDAEFFRTIDERGLTVKRRVKKKKLLEAFERLCNHYGVVSRGFHPEEITYPAMGKDYDGTRQWAMKHWEGQGWMIVAGAGGCGVVFGRAGGFFRKRWEFLLFIEGLTWASVELTNRNFMYAGPIPGKPPHPHWPYRDKD